MALKLPPLSCNAHCHVFGPSDRFAYSPDSPPPRADAPKDALFALNDRLGLERCVIVHSKVHGNDNGVTEDAIATRPGTYRGVALVSTDVSDAELSRLDQAGFRGVRFHYMSHLGRREPATDVLALGRRIAHLGWHLQIHGEPQVVLEAVIPRLLEGPALVVIDHIGRIDAGLGPEQPHIVQLRRLLENPRCWLKLSGIDRITAQGPPYADAIVIAARLASDHPDRIVWGNDWPHPNHQGPVPDDEALARHIFTTSRPIPPCCAR